MDKDPISKVFFKFFLIQNQKLLKIIKESEQYLNFRFILNDFILITIII